jgi:hypothetical protein
MRHFVAATLLLLGTAALAQQAPGTPPGAPPPGEGQPVIPAPTPQGQMPGMNPDPSAPSSANPNATPGQMPPKPGGQSGTMGRTADSGMSGTGAAMGTPRAGGDYPLCTREQRDNCRQPEGRSVPAPR